MKRLPHLAALLGLGLTTVATADPPYDKERYEAAFDLRTGDDEDQIHLKSCLKAWGTHPFGEEERYTARFFESNVRVMGIGQEMRDEAVTNYPQLILVKPSVNVMTKTTYELLNPMGWYCFDANVTVLGKAVLKADCAAHIANAREGAAVAAATDEEGSVAVFGAVRVERVGPCAEAQTETKPKNTETQE
ncbi:MAG: hypothetical protein JRI25_13775 [Deltaproteobacteria bacterium]|nr:hypothetical protein [Deltaproteobacteria bacterium]